MRILLTTSLIALIALGGCARHTQPVGPSQELTLAERNFEAVWDASLDVLGDSYFTIDRKDRRDGIITTLPMTGQQCGEFWRADAVGADAKTESTIQTIYRQVAVRISRTSPEAITYVADVEARTYRSDKPQPQITSTSQAIDLFRLPGGQAGLATDMLLDRGRTPLPPGDGMPGWVVDLGRDEDLETMLEAQIEVRTSKLQASLAR